MHIFLDFDGVLRRSTSPRNAFDDDLLANFESVVRASPKARIVICSTWRLAMPLAGIRGRFSHDVAARIVGTTPCLVADVEHPRYAEIKSWLSKNPKAAERWVAIDDDAENYPGSAPLIRPDPELGFDAACAARLKALLAVP
jgi:hypothetical protein